MENQSSRPRRSMASKMDDIKKCSLSMSKKLELLTQAIEGASDEELRMFHEEYKELERKH